MFSAGQKTALSAMTFESVPKPAVVKEADLPEYYVLLCARRYAAMVKKFALAATDDERRQHRKSLNYLLESGLIEADRERERRLRRYPDDFRKALVEKNGSIISRAITLEEAEILRCASSIPPIALIENLSANDMEGLADVFEGWAQSDLTDGINVARLLGWADGLRFLADAVGEAYTPPESGSGSAPSLLEFMAERMRHSR
jgi:hypothetical protein